MVSAESKAKITRSQQTEDIRTYGVCLDFLHERRGV